MEVKKLLRITLVIFWLAAFGWLLRYEAFPEFFTHKLDGYKSIISKDVLLIDSWMKISVNGSPVGYSYTKMEVEKSDPVNHYRIENSLKFFVNIAGTKQNISIRANSVLNNIYQLQNFFFSIKSKGYSMLIKGKKIEEKTFEVTTTTANTTQTKKVIIPEDVIIYSPMTEMAMKKLLPGQKLSILTFDPLTMSKANIMFTGEKKETIIIDNKEYETILISVNMKGAVSKLWIDSSSGKAIRQTTPFGWTMEKSTSKQAVKSVKGSDGIGDILTNLAVPVLGLPPVPDANAMKIVLRGVDLTKIEFESCRQKIVDSNVSETEILVANGNDDRALTRSLPCNKLSAEDRHKYLKPTVAVQSDHKQIIEIAEKITGKLGKTNDKIKAEAIFNWVYKNVKKEITISLPSALDVLNTMKGDCNEHTYLFVALARASNIPSRIITGLVFTKGKYYYHAWPAVYIDDKWFEMDPTWGQTYVDAGHIAIINGEIENQFRLLNLMGQINIEITEVIDD